MNRIFASALPAALFAFIFYLIGITTTYHYNNLFSDVARLIFILCVIGASVWAIINYRKRQIYMSYRQGLGVGIVTGILLGACISVHTFVFRQYIYTEYNSHSKAAYQYNLTEQYNSPRTDTTEGKKRWTPEQIDKQIERTSFYFTTKAGMIIDFTSTTIIALFTAITAAYMARKVKE